MSTTTEHTSGSAAKAIGITPSLVRRYCRDGRLAGRRFGRDWLIPAAAVKAFKRSR